MEYAGPAFGPHSLTAELVALQLVELQFKEGKSTS